MGEMNFDWDDLRLFLAVARAGGLSGAAKATGKSPPTLGRRMVALEKTTGAELFHRLPRGYALTLAGEQLLAEAEALEVRIGPLVEKQQSTLVKLSAGSWMTLVLCKRATDLVGGDDGITLRFIAADERLDIARREAVIGIRNARPTGIGLAARRVGRVEFAGYAVDEAPRPWARVMAPTPSAEWVSRQEAASFEVTTPRNALDLALAGTTRAILPTFIGGSQPDLVRVTDPIPELSHDQWLVSHHEERFAPAVRQVIKRLEAVLAELHRPS